MLNTYKVISAKIFSVVAEEMEVAFSYLILRCVDGLVCVGCSALSSTFLGS